MLLFVLLSFSGLEATGKIHADLATAGKRHSVSGPPAVGRFHTDQLVKGKIKEVISDWDAIHLDNL